MSKWMCAMGPWRAVVLAGLGLGLTFPLAPAARAGQTYLALGDSITFGVGKDDSAMDTGNGDRGYVAGYANYLATLAGGVRPNVINLAVSGETTSSFFGKGIGLDGDQASLRNTNYSASNPMSQEAMMLAAIQAEKDKGNTISTVTLTLGANDLFVALRDHTSFADAFATFQTNEISLLKEIRSKLPTTNLILLNYFDPYAPYLSQPNDPRYPIAVASSQAIPMINTMIANNAQAFGAGYADVFHPFVGNEIADTYIKDYNVHPNDIGYALITQAVTAVPEPSSVILVGVGIGLVALGGRARRAGRPGPAH